MSPEVRERLIELLALRELGERSASEEAELRGLLEVHPDLALAAGGDLAVERLLRYTLEPRPAADEFARGVLGRIRAEEDAERFVRQVVDGVTPERPRRRAHWARRRPARAPVAWIWVGSIAACAFVLVVAAATTAPRPDSPRPRAPEAAQAPGFEQEPPLQRAPRPPSLPRPPAPPPAEEPPPPLPAPQPPRPAPPPEPIPPPAVRPPAERPEPRPTTEAAMAVARIDRATGEVRLLEGVEARAGRDLRAGQGLRTGAAAQAALQFADGTRVELGAESLLRDLQAEGGKRMLLERGALEADVRRQPAGKPFVVVTPHAEAHVLGTTLRLSVGAEGTRLEVLQGRVRLIRLSDRKAVDVPAGHVASTAELAARPAPPLVLRVSFGPASDPVPAEFAGDDGSPFDEARGRGWSADFRQSTRLRAGTPRDLLVRRHIAAGNAEASARWEIAVPNGKYAVTVSVGDETTEQGPHRVVIEGVAAIRDLFTPRGKHRVVENVVVDVRDGRLTLECGAVGSRQAARDGSSDTVLNYVVITQVR